MCWKGFWDSWVLGVEGMGVDKGLGIGGCGNGSWFRVLDERGLGEALWPAALAL